jgi:hypothetical protein
MASLLHMNCRKVALAALDAPIRIRRISQQCSSNTTRLSTVLLKGQQPVRNYNYGAGYRRFLTTKNKKPKSSKEPASANQQGFMSQAWNKFLGPKPMPERWTVPWYREMVVICTVFAITGSSTMVLVRPAVSNGLGLHGSLKDGPWSYRICSLVIMTPIYATMLVGVGTIFGRHHYFRHFSVKMWSRFGIPPEMLDPAFHETKKHFRKW